MQRFYDYGADRSALLVFGRGFLQLLGLAALVVVGWWVWQRLDLSRPAAPPSLVTTEVLPAVPSTVVPPAPAMSDASDLDQILEQLRAHVDRVVTSQQAEVARCRALLLGAVRGELLVRLPGSSDEALAFVFVPAGQFRMGRTAREIQLCNLQTNMLLHDASGPQHAVTVTAGFFMSRLEVTVGQFRCYWSASGGTGPQPPPAVTDHSVAPDQPIREVSWGQASGFCRWLGEESGYCVRLPSEVEWEYAARGPTSAPYAVSNGRPFSNDPARTVPAAVGTDDHDVSWCGCRDMCGNVAEWCADWFDEHAYGTVPVRYQSSLITDQASAPSGSRVYRGGAFDDVSVNCQAATRRRHLPSMMSPYVGFRVVLLVPMRQVIAGGQ